MLNNEQFCKTFQNFKVEIGDIFYYPKDPKAGIWLIYDVKGPNIFTYNVKLCRKSKMRYLISLFSLYQQKLLKLIK